MKDNPKKTDTIVKYRIICTVCGIIVNVAGAFLVNRTGMPLYLDTIGTILWQESRVLFPEF